MGIRLFSLVIRNGAIHFIPQHPERMIRSGNISRCGSKSWQSSSNQRGSASIPFFSASKHWSIASIHPSTARKDDSSYFLNGTISCCASKSWQSASNQRGSASIPFFSAGKHWPTASI